MFRRIFNFIFDKMYNNFTANSASIGDEVMVLVAGRGGRDIDGKTLPIKGKTWYIVKTTKLHIPVTAYTVRRVD